jgi:retron-type reverse transcriptase
MPNALHNEIGSKEAIRYAWYEILSNSTSKSRNTLGNDGLSINDFLGDEKTNLRLAQRAARTVGYKFKTLRPYVIPKPNSPKFRVICVPTVQDRIIQRSLLNFLELKYGGRLANQISYGFIRGRTVREAVKQACELRKAHPWVLKTDITSFFDRVDRQILMTSVRRFVRETSLLNLLDSAIHCEIETKSVSAKRKIADMGIEVGKGIRQGMPLSPFFANIYLYEFDNWIHKEGFRAVRYADDLIFFLDSEAACHALRDRCALELKKLGLSIPEFEDKSKSVIYRPENAAEFLGLGLRKKAKGYALEVMPEQIQAIKGELGKFASVKEMNSRGISLATLGQRLTAKKSGYYAAYDCCANLKELERNMEDVTKNALRRLYQRDLHIDLSLLSAEARTFLMLE